MGNNFSEIVQTNEQSKKDDEDEFNYYSLDGYNKTELLNYIKQLKIKSLDVDDTYQDKLKQIDIESLNMLSMCVELYNKMKDQLQIYVPPTNVTTKKVYYVNPKFGPEQVVGQVLAQKENFLPSQVNNFDFWDTSNKPKIIFNTNNVTLEEFTDTFKDMNSAKDMLGVSKKMLALLPFHLKSRFVENFNKYLSGELSPSHISIGTSSYIYKDAKRGPKDDINSFRQIVTIPNITKHLHRIMTLRYDEYFRKNSLIDDKIQKGAVSGQKYGILEQICKIKQVIKSANKHKDTACIIFLDISNAFGSINLEMMYKVLEKYDVPENFINYVKDYYKDFTYYARVNFETTEQFKWHDGLVQGCPLSGILFVTVINYILQHLENEYLEEAGYIISLHQKLLFTAFIDDICIVTRDPEKAKHIFEKLVKILASFGMKVNESKCAIMSINCASSSTPLSTGLKEVNCYKYLGEYLSKDGTCLESYGKFIIMLGRKLFGLGKRKNITNEDRMKIYNKCIQPWMSRKLLVMYDLDNIQRMKIASLVKKYVEEWGGDVSKIVLFRNINTVLEQSKDGLIQDIELDIEDIKGLEQFEDKDLEQIEFTYDQINKEVDVEKVDPATLDDIVTSVSTVDKDLIDLD